MAITQIRLAQQQTLTLPLTGQAIAYDCCSEDGDQLDPESGVRSNAGSCNLHPQDKECPSVRLAKRVLQVAFGQGTDATMDSPRFKSVLSVAISNTSGVRIALDLENAAGLKLMPARVCEKIKPYPVPGQSCCEVRVCENPAPQKASIYRAGCMILGAGVGRAERDHVRRTAGMDQRDSDGDRPGPACRGVGPAVLQPEQPDGRSHNRCGRRKKTLKTPRPMAAWMFP